MYKWEGYKLFSSRISKAEIAEQISVPVNLINHEVSG